MRKVIGVAAFASIAFSSALASATPRPLPVTYTYETSAEGESEIEQYVDLSPALGNPVGSSKRTTYLGSQFQTEYEYGITDRLELGLYVTLQPSYASNISNTSNMMEGSGTKQRLRYRLFDEGELPIDIGFYGEVTENERYLELEAKVILQKRFGNLRAIVNLVGEHEFYYNGDNDWEINPSGGLVYQVTPVFQPGVEYWMDREWPSQSTASVNIDGVNRRPLSLGPNHYVGPTALFDFGKIWWSVGAYARVNDVGLTQEYGNGFGSVWFRSIIGVNL